MITAKTTLEELAFIVSGALQKHGIKATLTGGGVVSIYTENKYQSYDLDFVSEDPIKNIEKALKEIGFIKSKSRYFEHKETKFFVEFIQPPVAIGDTLIKEYNKLNKDENTLYLLTPTHCVMDRLSAYYHWNDNQSLEQAILVAKSNKVDLKLIEKWSGDEGAVEKFKVFKGRLADKSK
ncbi:MAG: hypothetical protein JXA66_07325 [Oligoflexia bacterium]|nr:hypothetical protein [Oligoflexia bacterium]